MHCVVNSELPSSSSVTFVTTGVTGVLSAPVRDENACPIIVLCCLLCRVGKANGVAEKRAQRPQGRDGKIKLQSQ